MEPDVFDVYTPTTLRVRVWPTEAVTAGTVIACQLPNSFYAYRFSQSHTQRLQTEDPSGAAYVSVQAVEPGTGVRFEVEIAARELITDTEGSVRHGQRVLATLQGGDLPAGSEVVFTFARMYSPWVANQDEYYLVSVGGAVVEPWPTFRVRPGPATWQRLIVPSCARPGEPFRVLLVSLDRYDNVSSTSCAGVTLAVEAGPGSPGEALEAEIAFQGRYETRVSLPEEGVYRLVACGTLGESADAAGLWAGGVVSNPIRITAQPSGPYWGDIHVHSHVSCDALGNEPYQYAKAVSGLDFAGVCDHANAHLPAQWARVVAWAREHEAAGQFVTLLGYEGGVAGKSFHHNVYYPDLDARFDDVEFLRGSAMSEEDLRAHLERTGGLSQLHQSGTCATDMREPYFPSTRLIEIYSHWGQSEAYNPDHALSYEVNRVRYPETRLTISGRGPFYARDAWALGKRYVTIASSDDHNGQAGKAHRGIAGVYAGALTRSAIFGGLKAGTCYGTTGERILLDFRCNGQSMGSELAAQPGQALEFGIEVHGTDVLCTVEAFRYRFPAESAGAEAKWESVYHEDFPDRGLAGGRQRDWVATWTEQYKGPAVYYLRVRQKYLVRDRPVYAWSTPIWVGG
jgi:hypothetical protein